MSDKSLVEVWDEYYATPGDTAIKDRPFFDLEVRTLVERVEAEARGIGAGQLAILELGSGTGYLAARVVERLTGVTLRYDGVDFSQVGVRAANERSLPGSAFHELDFTTFVEGCDTRYDMIVTQRSIMAIMDPTDQVRLLELLRDRLAPGGLGLFSEGSVQGLARLNELRAGLGLDPLDKVWHSRYLDENDLARVFREVETEHFASLYWLATRVLYPYFEEPQHDTPLHRFAATLPPAGDFSPVRLFAVRV